MKENKTNSSSYEVLCVVVFITVLKITLLVMVGIFLKLFMQHMVSTYVHKFYLLIHRIHNVNVSGLIIVKHCDVMMM